MHNQTFRFLEPHFLVLLPICGVAAIFCLFRIFMRFRDARRFRELRLVPRKERIGKFGATIFYLSVCAALAFLAAAAARPQIESDKTMAADNIPIDIIVLQDGSASQLIKDVPPSRWQRSIHFVRILAKELRWGGDRMALAVFAGRAAPESRFTTDPNNVLFALDHLAEKPPFSPSELEFWDTNIAEGIRWGIKLFDKDVELNGPSPNKKAMVIVSDGLAWDGDVEAQIAAARERRMPVYVVGIGTDKGGYIPDSELYSPDRGKIESPADTRIDRKSLKQIADVSGGSYFEIGSRGEEDIADRIIASAKRGGIRGGEARAVDKHFEDIYLYFLIAAGVCFCLGVVSLI